MKKITVIGSFLILVMLTGCTGELPDMTDEQTAMVTEYASNLLIKYNNLSSRTLLNDSQLEIAEAKEAEEKEKQRKKEEAAQAYLQQQEEEQSEEEESNVKDEKQEYIMDVASFLDMEGVSVEYAGCSLCDSYPDETSEDAFFAIEATEGKKLCILNFTVTNQSSEDKELDMFSKQARFYLQIEDEKMIPVQTTLLFDDFSSYKNTMAAGASENMVLLFEVSDTVTQASRISMTVQYGEDKGVISLQ
ncbi:MAG: hypothetical protein PUB13_06375 [Lachnospiraceae bacterium]|nr:hypothetical protein [Lachnospiraceae bacterium]